MRVSTIGVEGEISHRREKLRNLKKLLFQSLVSPDDQYDWVKRKGEREREGRMVLWNDARKKRTLIL